ncbi:MAG: hypothetical protein ACFCUX_05785 [Candidatus Methylacidiphilales bacterium]
MKKQNALVIVLVICMALIPLTHAQAQYFQKQMEALRLNISTGESSPDMPGSRFSQAREELNALQQLESYIANDDYTNAIRIAKQALARTENASNKKLWESLLKDLEKQQATYHATLKKKVDDKLSSVAAAVIKAQKMEDLDPIVDDLTDFQNTELNRGNSTYISRLRQQVSQASSFINRWQNYLEASTAESPSRQIEVLNDLIRNRSSYRLIPSAQLIVMRDKLVALQTEKVASLQLHLGKRLKTIRTAEEMQPLLDEISELQNSLSSVQTSRRTLDRISNTLNAWLNVLHAESSGSSESLLNALSNFESNHYNHTPGLISPEMIESRQQAALNSSTGKYEKNLRVIRPLVDQALQKSIKDANPHLAVESLDLLQNRLNRSPLLRQQVYALKSDLERLGRMKHHLAQHRPTNFFQEGRQSLTEDNPWYQATKDLHEPLLLKGLEQFFSLKLSIPKKGNLNTALIDAARNAAGKGNWEEAATCYHILDTLNPACGAGNWSVKKLATQSYLEAQRLHQAGEDEPAILRLHNVLSAPADGIPQKEALALLATLRGKK